MTTHPLRARMASLLASSLMFAVPAAGLAQGAPGHSEREASQVSGSQGAADANQDVSQARAEEGAAYATHDPRRSPPRAHAREHNIATHGATGTGEIGMNRPHANAARTPTMT